MFDSVNFIACYYEICKGVTFIGTQCICMYVNQSRLSVPQSPLSSIDKVHALQTGSESTARTSLATVFTVQFRQPLPPQTTDAT